MDVLVKLQIVFSVLALIGIFLSMRWIGLLLISFTAHAEWTVVRDLRGDWLQYVSGGYRPLEGRDSHVRTIYFSLNAGTYKGHRLLIGGPEEWQLFINGSL